MRRKNLYPAGLVTGVLAASSVYFLTQKSTTTTAVAFVDETSSPVVVKLQKTLSTNSTWKSTLEKVLPSIVTLKIGSPRTFDLETPGFGTATGFVVDAQRGIILTNRHVIKSGPVVAEAVFHNNEEIDITPIYRDPVHDFGFFKYNPDDLRFMSDISSVALCPEKAHVGTDIRVVGNNAAEKLSISSSTLARVDRAAPNYGPFKYNDFNTFYFQAASGQSGGSSGSPVLNADGQAIALNSGCKIGTSASFYFPLDRVKRAYEYLSRGEAVPRGTIQTIFGHEPFDKLKRLGLAKDTEAMIRQSFPTVNGMLMVQDALMGGPAQDKLKSGDVLVSVNEVLVTAFTTLEEIFDSNVNTEILLTVDRAGKRHDIPITVQDLHSITPSDYFEIGGAVINPLSYQLARHMGTKVGSPYLAYAGYMFTKGSVPSGSVLLELDGQPCTYDSVKTFFSTCQDGQPVRVKYIHPRNRSKTSISVIHVDRKWFSVTQCARNDTAMTWDCKALQRAVTPSTSTSTASSSELPVSSGPSSSQVLPVPLTPSSSSLTPSVLLGETQMLKGKNAMESQLAHSLVGVHFSRPFPVNNFATSGYIGTGLVVDAAAGLVVVDRNTVPDHAGDAYITIANTLHVPATVVFVHPIHNFAVIQYDPAAIGTTPIQSCRVASHPLLPASPVWLVGFKGENNDRSYTELVSRETLVTGIKWMDLPLPFPPKYQEHNLEVVAIQDQVSTLGGVLVTPQGDVSALWCSFAFEDRKRQSQQVFRGIPMDIIMKSVAPLMTSTSISKVESTLESKSESESESTSKDTLCQEESSPASTSSSPSLALPSPLPCLYDLGIDFQLISLAKGRALGMSEDLAKALEAHAPEHRSVLCVLRRWGGSDAATKLQNGDLLVKVNQQLVTSFREVEAAVNNHPKVSVTVLRGDTTHTLDLATYPVVSSPQRFVLWQGMIVQPVPLAVISQVQVSGHPSRHLPPSISVTSASSTTGEDRPSEKNQTIQDLTIKIQDKDDDAPVDDTPKAWQKSHEEGVYVTSNYLGSPAGRYGPPATSRIVSIEGVPIRHLDDFLTTVRATASKPFVRVSYLTLAGKSRVTSVKLATSFWPTSELRCDEDTKAWTRINYPHTIPVPVVTNSLMTAPVPQDSQE